MKNLLRGTTLLLLFVSILSFNACTKDNDPVLTPATCTDGIQNGDETGVDCGGDCAPCTVAATCTDGIQNGDETGVDCGGSCDPCATAATCTDGIQNGDETGIDCGGSCDPCTTAATCTDGIQNGDETGIDCGGSCDPCTSSLSMREYIETNAQFSILNDVIVKAGFDIDGMGPYTFFAPNNAAWEVMLENNSWTSIDQISAPVLNTILQYHVSDSGMITSDQFSHGQEITIRYQSKVVRIDLDDPANPKVVAGLTNAGIVGIDQVTTNGVIHEMDGVLLF